MATLPSTPAPPHDAAYRLRRRRAIQSAFAGFAIDNYSIYIVSTALLPALIYFQSGLDPADASIFAGMTLGVTLIGRPFGALIFGHFADRIGRQRVGAITIYGFGTISLLIALLPGAELVGPTVAMTLLLVLRFLEGIFLGGEYTAATPLAIEYAPGRRRGVIAGVVQCAANFGSLMVAAVMALTLLFSPSGGLDSPYVQWGWRIPFVVGAILSYFIGRYLRRQVEDSATWKAATKTKSPLRDMLKGRSGRTFIQCYLIMTGVFLISNIGGNVKHQFLLASDGFTAADLANLQLITAVPSMCMFVLFGWISDHIGRKRALYLAASLQIIVIPTALTAIALEAVHGFGPLLLLALLISMAGGTAWGVASSYLNERFATSVRSSGFGVAWSTAVVIPSFFSYYMVWLSALVPFEYTAGIIVVIGALLILGATSMGPETQGIDLSTAGPTARPLAATAVADDPALLTARSGGEPTHDGEPPGGRATS